MKNGDLPAMPSGVLQDGHNCGEYPLNSGLTKRETIFIHVLGHVFSTQLQPGWESLGYKYEDDVEIVKRAISLVDIGLAELERTK